MGIKGANWGSTDSWPTDEMKSRCGMELSKGEIGVIETDNSPIHWLSQKNFLMNVKNRKCFVYPLDRMATSQA